MLHLSEEEEWKVSFENAYNGTEKKVLIFLNGKHDWHKTAKGKHHDTSESERTNNK